MKVLSRSVAESGAVVEFGMDAAGRWSTICTGTDAQPHWHAEAWPSIDVAVVALARPWEWCEAPGCPQPARCPLCREPGRTSAESRQRDVSEDRWRLVSQQGKEVCA